MEMFFYIVFFHFHPSASVDKYTYLNIQVVSHHLPEASAFSSAVSVAT